MPAYRKRGHLHHKEALCQLWIFTRPRDSAVGTRLQILYCFSEISLVAGFLINEKIERLLPITDLLVERSKEALFLPALAWLKDLKPSTFSSVTVGETVIAWCSVLNLEVLICTRKSPSTSPRSNLLWLTPEVVTVSKLVHLHLSLPEGLVCKAPSGAQVFTSQRRQN